MTLLRWLVCLLVLLPTAMPGAAAPQPAPLSRELSKPFTGDLDEMRKRGIVRVLVSYNRTNYFIEEAKAFGFEYELMEQFRKFLNKRTTRKQLKTAFVFLPVPFDRLIPYLNEGRGDIAAAGLTVTAKRAGKIAFSDPYLSEVREVLVAAPATETIRDVDGLSGREVHLLRGSSYAQHLQDVNRRLQETGLAPIAIVQVDENLQTEDLLELANAGIIEFTVADDHIARIWGDVLPNLQVYDDVFINDQGSIAWAVRKSNPQLLKQLNQFVAEHKRGSLLGNILFKRYYKNSPWISNLNQAGERERFKEVAGLFRRYAGKYGFDWLKIAAQAYQESGLDHDRTSLAGAVGIMQVLRSTAADKNVGIKDIEKLEQNIHAGVKYLAFLRDRYFSDAAIPADDRTYLAFAAYNAGPKKVQRMRDRAEKMGLDPNRWFGNVELAALRIVGQETVQYVRNILKYYTAYRLSLRAVEKRRDGRALLCGESKSKGAAEACVQETQLR